ncbi:MAG: tetratricopeptide repeat protein [Planctomycetaceae bacterium]
MTVHLARGHLLLQQSRPQQAMDEYRRHLLEEPNDPQAHAHLALCLGELKQYEAATQHAEQAIGLAPDAGFPHFVAAHIDVKRNRLGRAKAAIDQAIELEPYFPSFFYLRGAIAGEQHRWGDALADADAGLEIDPEDTDCLNLRTKSLMKLGRRGEAGQAIAAALRHDPHNAYTHSTQGWTLLEQGRPKPAMEHFREALRLEPESEWARAGIVEAMKARHFIYRIFLGYIFWMSRMSPRARWGVVIGGYVGFQLLRRVSAAHPGWSVWLLPLLIAYVAFALLTWLAGPLFNLLLRLSRFGRLALSADQARAANLFGVLLLSACGLLLAALIVGNPRLLIAALYTGLLMLPATAIWTCPTGWPRWTMAGCTAALAITGIVSLTQAVLVNGEMRTTDLGNTADSLFLFGIIGSQFLANVLANVRVVR